MVLRRWKIKGHDGNMYSVEERVGAAQWFNSVSGQRALVQSCTLEYILADGSDLFNEKEGEWKTQSGVILKHPDDL